MEVIRHTNIFNTYEVLVQKFILVKSNQYFYNEQGLAEIVTNLMYVHAKNKSTTLSCFKQ
jgi:hypothetical protein